MDFFNDHLQRINKQVRLTKDDDPTVWCSIIAATFNHHIRQNGFTPIPVCLGQVARRSDVIHRQHGGRQQAAVSAERGALRGRTAASGTDKGGCEQVVLRVGQQRRGAKSDSRKDTATSPTIPTGAVGLLLEERATHQVKTIPRISWMATTGYSAGAGGTHEDTPLRPRSASAGDA